MARSGITPDVVPPIIGTNCLAYIGGGECCTVGYVCSAWCDGWCCCGLTYGRFVSLSFQCSSSVFHACRTSAVTVAKTLSEVSREATVIGIAKAGIRGSTIRTNAQLSASA